MVYGNRSSNNTADSQVVTQPGTDAALQDLTSVIGREPVLSLWCGRRRREQVKSCSIAVFRNQTGKCSDIPSACWQKSKGFEARGINGVQAYGNRS